MNISISSRTGSRDWDALVQADRAHRALYTDPAVFDEEMTKVFGAVWVYLGHESQIPHNDDFLTTKLGRRPVKSSVEARIREATRGVGGAIVDG